MASTGRITCPRCGANNFDTVTVCWKCGTPLTVAAAAPEPPAARAQLQHVASAGRSAVASATANRSAIALGLLFPYFGLPIALAFMMCEEPRRQEVGRVCLLWSIVSMVFHLLFGLAAVLSISGLVSALLNSARGSGMKLPGGLPRE